MVKPSKPQTKGRPFLDVGDLHGVEGVPGRGDDAVVDEVVFGVEVEVLAEGLLAGVGARKR
jgi:hypothetical protein